AQGLRANRTRTGAIWLLLPRFAGDRDLADLDGAVAADGEGELHDEGVAVAVEVGAGAEGGAAPGAIDLELVAVEDAALERVAEEHPGGVAPVVAGHDGAVVRREGARGGAGRGRETGRAFL